MFTIRISIMANYYGVENGDFDGRDGSGESRIGPKWISQSPRSVSPGASTFSERDGRPTHRSKAGKIEKLRLKKIRKEHFPKEGNWLMGENKRNGMYALPVPSQLPLFKYRSVGLAEWFRNPQQYRTREILDKIVGLLRQEGEGKIKKRGPYF